ncbi:RNA polymerase sigma factor RpoE [Labilithrix luteola]|uniref:RNA polymerase sigma factor RpoE n=1 Tax=Labilithrix luteola TaxID=1391654 RepID=A0A0K1PMU4_9BACT|nr:sigma-70 family RNA polymerase sigma factor [Labilithrix luteola]AKU94860.1 RNA polymerase sigma factor RpoE [Labilithrix luteola]
MQRSREDDDRLRATAKAEFANVWRFLRRLGVPTSSLDDATQEVFLVAARKFGEVQPGREKSYLFGTAVHVARELRRKHGREQLADDPDDEAMEPASTSTPEDSLGTRQEYDVLVRLLDGLTDDLRTVFILFEIEGQSLTEISTILGVPLGTVSSRLRRARADFELRLQKFQKRMRGGR